MILALHALPFRKAIASRLLRTVDHICRLHCPLSEDPESQSHIGLLIHQFKHPRGSACLLYLFISTPTSLPAPFSLGAPAFSSLAPLSFHPWSSHRPLEMTF